MASSLAWPRNYRSTPSDSSCQRQPRATSRDSVAHSFIVRIGHRSVSSGIIHLPLVPISTYLVFFKSESFALKLFLTLVEALYSAYEKRRYIIQM